MKPCGVARFVPIAILAACVAVPASGQQTWDPADTDGDGLSDAWERHYFGDLTKGAGDDSDLDSVPAWLEFERDSDPTLAKTNGSASDWEGIPGYLRCERWNGIQGEKLHDLFESTLFRTEPAGSLIGEARIPANVGDNYGIRIRGTMRAPASGNYQFFISSDDEGELWLGSSADRFSRRRVASVGSWTNPSEWNKLATQASQVVTLAEGQEYWIEALMKEGGGGDNLAIGWTRPGITGIEVIPGRLANGTVVLSTPVTPATDMDDDGLPDAWESTVGLNPGDNGRINAADGGYSDWDGDGISNFEEWLTGGDPLAQGGNVGLVRRDRWSGVTGTGITDLTGNARFAGMPDSSTWEQPMTLAFPSTGDNYGQRLTGCIVPPRSGKWRFWIASDDASELWFSPDASRLNKTKIAFVSGWTNSSDFDVTPSQKSQLVTLTAGTPYFYEVLHKEGDGGDHASVAWAYEPPNLALASQGATATQSSTYYWAEAALAIDGNTNGGWGDLSLSHTQDQANSWLQIDLGQTRPLNRVVL